MGSKKSTESSSQDQSRSIPPNQGSSQEATAEERGPVLKHMTNHQFIKTTLYPMLLEPMRFMRGFRLLFGGLHVMFLFLFYLC